MTTMQTSATGAPEDAAKYTFTSATEEPHRQLLLLADILDSHSIDVLSKAGVTDGWQCLDAGPGAGTITSWLADRIGPAGNVTAVDLDPKHLRRGDNTRVVADDIRTMALPQDTYDLIHARLLLMHLPEREDVLKKFVTALKPGGTLVTSDWGQRDGELLLHAETPAAAEAYSVFVRTLETVLQANGADLGWARRAPLAMRAAGLTDIDTVVHNRLWRGGQPGNLIHISASHLVHDVLLSHGVTEDHIALLRATMADPQTLAYGHWTYTTTARKPR
jgi:SAM-dependent methyltransferase